MMQSRADLHAHTTASDGTLTPRELVRRAASRGLFALAVTDHDTVAGVEEAREAGYDLGVEVIAGVEISCAHGEREIHLLGLFVDTTQPSLISMLEESRRQREKAAERVLERLRTLGAPVDIEDVRRFSKGETLGRPHFAKALEASGHVRSHDEAFERFLGEGRPAYVHRARPTVAQACEAIHAAGGVAGLGHPGGRPGLLSKQEVLRMKAAGLDAIEVYHPAHDERTERRVARWAAEMRLLTTGGSDFHRPSEGAELGSRWLEERDLSPIRALADRWRSLSFT